MGKGGSHFKSRISGCKKFWTFHFSSFPNIFRGEGGWGCSQVHLLYISSSWVIIRKHADMQLPGFLASASFWCGCDCYIEGVKTRSTPSRLSWWDFDKNIAILVPTYQMLYSEAIFKKKII